VVNVEVPVRVFEGARFVDDLQMEDFQILEDGVPQKIEAVYLVRKKAVERSQEVRRFVPSTSRHFFLFFEISDYTSDIGRAVDFFHEKVLTSGDELFVVTPRSTYQLRSEVLGNASREALSAQMKEILRKDALMGNAEYRGAMKELIGLARALSAGQRDEYSGQPQQLDEYTLGGSRQMSLEKQLMRCINILNRVRKLRYVDQKRLLAFAERLKNQQGQKAVFIIYQRELLPQIEQSVLQKYIALYQNKPHIYRSLYGLFDTVRRDISFDVDRVKKAYADASVSIHFLFLTPPLKYRPGIQFSERSEDVFGAFREMAAATGGFVDSSANPASSLERAITASENYYLLYYSPSRYKADGRFREIKVRVNRPGFRVTHRMGYFAEE